MDGSSSPGILRDELGGDLALEDPNVPECRLSGEAKFAGWWERSRPVGTGGETIADMAPPQRL